MKKILLLFLVFAFPFGCTLSDPEMLELLMEIKAQNETLQKEINGIKSQLTDLDNNYQKIIESLADDKKAIEELKKQVDALKNQINLLLDQIKKLSEQLAIQGADVEKLSKEIAELKASIAELIKKLEELINQQNSNAFFEQNGTIKCQDAKVGDKGIVNGKQYEAVDRALLIKRRDEGADLTCVCTSLVTDMSNIFQGTLGTRNDFNQKIGNWDLSNVTNMRGMFNFSNFNQSIEAWDVSKVENMNLTFSNSNFNSPIEKWNVKNVKSMIETFAGSKFNQSLATWDVSNVTVMTVMFSTSIFNQPLGNWNVSSVIDMVGMFYGSSFNQPIKTWNVANVRTMAAMFENSQFNQPINDWNVKNVESMRMMFFNAKNFNQDISKWCVGKISDGQSNEKFATGSPLTASFYPKWGTCPSGSESLVERYPVGSVFCSNGPTEIVDVVNPNTGKTWMDRNLGAKRAAISKIDEQAYGDLYQWGRLADGHQCRNSKTTTTSSNKDQPGHGDFILVYTNVNLTPASPSDWRNPANQNLWQGQNGINNPCPSGYRLPTLTELENERKSWTTNESNGAFNSPLKFTLAGYRSNFEGEIADSNFSGSYWSSSMFSATDTYAGFLVISNSSLAEPIYFFRARGHSVRCIKN